MSNYQRDKKNYIDRYGIDAWRKRNRESAKQYKERKKAKLGEEEYNKQNYQTLKKWISKNREGFNAIHRRYRKNKPAAMQRARKRWLEKLKADPVRYEAMLNRRREYSKNRMESLKADPVKYAEYKKKQSINSKLRYAKLKENPVEYKAYIDKQLHYIAKRNEKLS